MPAIRFVPYGFISWMLVSGAAFAADAPVAQSLDTPASIAAEASVAGVEADAGAGHLLQVPAGTTLAFEMVDSLSSKTSQRGDRFSLRLVEPLVMDGQLLIPAGTLAVGEVVHADRARAGGQAGELILAARYLDWDGRQLPLKSFRAGVGRSRTDAAVGVMVAAGVAGFLVRGGQLEIAAGSPISATLREAVELPVLPMPAAADPAATEAGEENTVIATPAVPATPATAAINDTTSGETSE